MAWRWTMRRYGDNVTPDEALEDKPGEGIIDNGRVFYGGCAAGYGAFKRPSQEKARRPVPGFWALLGLRRKKTKPENG